MADDALSVAVERLAAVMAGADDERLGRRWTWGAYEDEGARFAGLRACEELRALAVRVAHERDAAGNPPTQAQRILAQYHAAYRDLCAALVGVDEVAFALPPREGEWPVREALGHMVAADGGFFVACSYALEQHRGGNADPGQPPEAHWYTTLGDEQVFNAVMTGPLDEVRAFHAGLHSRILALLSTVRDDELELPARFWEPEAMPLRFRLHRFESHLRQHTVQVDTTLAALGHAPGEGRRLARLLHAALADAEGAALGAEGTLGAEQARLAEALAALGEEIAAVMG